MRLKLLFLLKLVFVLNCSALEVAKKFSQNEIVRDLGLKEAPNEPVIVVFPSGVSAELGNELTPTQVEHEPTLEWDSEPGVLYTILLTDLDATSRAYPILREVRHWMVMNVKNNDIDDGDTIVQYSGSAPGKDGGLHRYTFLVFEQFEYIDTRYMPRIANYSREGRVKTETAKLIKDFGLKQPRFGNFYFAQFDDLVPKVHKMLGLTW